MLGCHNVSQDLTAWIEGELPERRCDHIREHLTACARCSSEADSLRTVIVWQQRALRTVLHARVGEPQAVDEVMQEVALA